MTDLDWGDDRCRESFCFTGLTVYGQANLGQPGLKVALQSSDDRNVHRGQLGA
jgi:hypothetical protein